MNYSEHIAKLQEHGYTVLPKLISGEACDLYKDLLERDYSKYSSNYISSSPESSISLANKTGEKVVYNLHNKDIRWFDLFQNNHVLSVIAPLLQEGTYQGKEPFYLNNISARCPLKGHGGQQLHLDSNLPGNNYCIIANVLWALDDFTEDNGSTRVVPGSHRWGEYPKDGETHPDEIRLTTQKGSAIIFNAGLWHGGGENTTDASRWAVALGYARWFIKPSFDFMSNTPTEIFAQMTDEQKELLGFNSVPPKDEFTRLRRRSVQAEHPYKYDLPNTGRV